VGVEGLDVLRERVAVLEGELVAAGPLDGHGQRESLAMGGIGHLEAELLVDQQPARPARGALGEGALEAVVDELLELGDPCALVRARITVDAHQRLLERAALVEGQDVEGLAHHQARVGRTRSRSSSPCM
jgi:hypothetical protein